jgi:hypothetical protein
MTPETNLQQRKLELIQWLTLVDDDSVLEKVARLKEEDSADWWDTISEDERSSIQKGMEDAENGNLKSHSDARAIYEKWL